MSNEEQILITLQKLLEAQEQTLAIQRQSFENQQRAIASQQIALKSQLATARIYRIALCIAALVIAVFLYYLLHVWR